MYLCYNIIALLPIIDVLSSVFLEVTVLLLCDCIICIIIIILHCVLFHYCIPFVQHLPQGLVVMELIPWGGLLPLIGVLLVLDLSLVGYLDHYP